MLPSQYLALLLLPWLARVIKETREERKKKKGKQEKGKERKKEQRKEIGASLELGGCGLGCASCGTTLEVSNFN